MLAEFLAAQVRTERPGLARSLVAMLDQHQATCGAEHLCGTCGTSWPCATLRLLAHAYDDRPDFHDEWRVPQMS